MALVILQFEVLVTETEDVFDCRIEAHAWQGKGARDSCVVHLFHVIGVQVRIAECVNDSPGARS